MENTMCVIKGKKRFTLFSPVIYLSNHYWDMWRYTLNISIHTSRMMCMQVVFLIFRILPQKTWKIIHFSRKQNQFKYKVEINHWLSLKVTIEEGDVLFTPSYWWHEVDSFQFNIAVNMFYYPHSWLLSSYYAALREFVPTDPKEYQKIFPQEL